MSDSRSPDAETLLILVSTGIGITVIPEAMVKAYGPATDLSFIPLEGEHEYVDLLAMWKEDNKNPITGVFRDFVIAHTKE